MIYYIILNKLFFAISQSEALSTFLISCDMATISCSLGRIVVSLRYLDSTATNLNYARLDQTRSEEYKMGTIRSSIKCNWYLWNRPIMDILACALMQFRRPKIYTERSSYVCISLIGSLTVTNFSITVMDCVVMMNISSRSCTHKKKYCVNISTFSP